MGFLYLIKCNEFYKIGVATDVQSRLATLQTGNPYPLQVIEYFEFENPLPVEQSLHQKFGDSLELREWFRLETNDLIEFEKICILLGGKKQSDLVSVNEYDVADAEEDEESKTRAKQAPEEIEKMIADGWRVEVAHSGRYYFWRRGSNDNREHRHGGYFSDLPKERQEEYYRNKARRNGQTIHI